MLIIFLNGASVLFQSADIPSALVATDLAPPARLLLDEVWHGSVALKDILSQADLALWSRVRLLAIRERGGPRDSAPPASNSLALSVHVIRVYRRHLRVRLASQLLHLLHGNLLFGSSISLRVHISTVVKVQQSHVTLGVPDAASLLGANGSRGATCGPRSLGGVMDRLL